MYILYWYRNDVIFLYFKWYNTFFVIWILFVNTFKIFNSNISRNFLFDTIMNCNQGDWNNYNIIYNLIIIILLLSTLNMSFHELPYYLKVFLAMRIKKNELPLIAFDFIRLLICAVYYTDDNIVFLIIWYPCEWLYLWSFILTLHRRR